MEAQTIAIPVGYLVTYSIETGHPLGVCRHMGISRAGHGAVPTLEAVWMVAECFGFVYGLFACKVWFERVQRAEQRAVTVNVVQPMDMRLLRLP